MIMGAAVSTVYYNLKLRHPTIDMPIIDYDLALLIQPMLMLGISIGVAFNVVFADWMVTVLLIVLFLGNYFRFCCSCYERQSHWKSNSRWRFAGTSTKAFCRGVETWNKETALKKVIMCFLSFTFTFWWHLEDIQYLKMSFYIWVSQFFISKLIWF